MRERIVETGRREGKTERARLERERFVAEYGEAMVVAAERFAEGWADRMIRGTAEREPRGILA